MGRKKIEIDLFEVERLAGLGLSEEQIGLALGVSQSTITRRKLDTDDFGDAIKKGRAAGVQHVVNRLREAIDAGNITATLFFLKCRAGWTEQAALEERITRLEERYKTGGSDRGEE